jgi:hypothetical protein
MAFRLKLALIVIGGVLVFIGGREWFVSRGATAEPAAVDLAALERGETPGNNHMRIGRHVALYPEAIFKSEVPESQVGPPGPGAKVNYCYYPIISHEHPFIQAVAKLVANEGGPENVADRPALPGINNFAVLVKTKRFKTVGAIPDDPGNETAVQGLAINRIESLEDEAEKLIKQSFPTVDLEKVIILEDGRKPASFAGSWGMMLGGLALAALGVGLFFAGRDKSR